MDTDSGEPRDRLRHAIDDEINSLEQSIDSIWDLKSRRNALAPISSLPPETLAAIFSFLSNSANDEASNLKWICVSHVCRQWRETALCHPRVWSHINLSKPAPVAVAEILARAKMAPLHFEVDFTDSRWESEQIDAFYRLLEAHVSQTRYLQISGPLPPLERLVSSAPTLESLSLLHRYGTDGPVVIPFNLFNCTTPRLKSLKLESCDFSWKSPLFKGLQSLEIRWASAEARLKLKDWLDALNEMPQLKSLSLHSATPVASPTALISEPSRTVTLPSLTKFDISASAKSCTLAFAHLVMPALTSLHVVAKSHEVGGEDVRPLIPYISRNVYGLQDTEPLRSVQISGERMRANVFAWIMPDADLEKYDPNKFGATAPARLTFVATGTDWHRGVDTGIFDALLTLLPMDSVSTFTAQSYTRLSKEFWLSQAPRLPSLVQAHLVPTAVKAFRDMLVEDAPPDDPRLPSLTKLILLNVTLTALRTFSLRDMLIERVEQGVPLEVLDLRTCYAPECVTQLLREIVVDVKGSLAMNRLAMKEADEYYDFATWEPELFNLHTEIGYANDHLNETEFDDDPGPWYDDMYDDDNLDGAYDNYDDHYDDSELSELQRVFST